MTIENQHGLEGSKVLPKKKSLLQFDLKKMAKAFYFSPEMFTKLPKSDVLHKMFVKMTQKIIILLDIFNKSALRII